MKLLFCPSIQNYRKFLYLTLKFFFLENLRHVSFKTSNVDFKMNKLKA